MQTTQNIIQLTEKAALKIKQMQEKENKKDCGFRIGVVPGGCSGYMYELGLEKEARPKDHIFEERGIKIFISQESVSFISGSTIDFASGLMNTGFKINNPNVKRTCGCGHSVG